VPPPPRDRHRRCWPPLPPPPPLLATAPLPPPLLTLPHRAQDHLPNIDDVGVSAADRTQVAQLLLVQRTDAARLDMLNLDAVAGMPAGLVPLPEAALWVRLEWVDKRTYDGELTEATWIMQVSPPPPPPPLPPPPPPRLCYWGGAATAAEPLLTATVAAMAAAAAARAMSASWRRAWMPRGKAAARRSPASGCSGCFGTQTSSCSSASRRWRRSSGASWASRCVHRLSPPPWAILVA
jgi:hypothetical protein